MRKQERRAGICLLIAAVLFAGLVIFGVRLFNDGGKWASFYGNTQIYTDGVINRGTITDRNDVLLMECTTDGVIYSDNSSIRKSTVHAVGDPEGNIASGAVNVFKSQLIGYDLLNGTYDTSSTGKRIRLTIDAYANKAAYEALAGRTGAVGVYNWKTGEIMCMVSTPTFDPAWYLPDDEDSSYYFNNFLDGKMTPGSTFKTVTAAAVIDKIKDRDSFSFDCDGVNEYEGTDFTDVKVHGTVSFRDALAQSCLALKRYLLLHQGYTSVLLSYLSPLLHHNKDNRIHIHNKVLLKQRLQSLQQCLKLQLYLKQPLI